MGWTTAVGAGILLTGTLAVDTGLTEAKAGGARERSFSGTADHMVFSLGSGCNYTPTSVVLGCIAGSSALPQHVYQIQLETLGWFVFTD